MSVKKHAVLLILTQAFSMLIGIISGIYITRLLGPEGKGVFAKLNASIGLLNLLFGLSTSIGLVYFAANKKIKLGKLLSIAILSILLSSSLILILYVVLSILGLEHLILPANYKVGVVVLFLLVMSLLNRINYSSYSIFRGLTLFNTTYIITIITNLASLGLFAFLYYKNNQSPFADQIRVVLLAQLSLGMFVVFMWIWAIRKKVNVSPDFKLSFEKDLRPFYKYSILSYSTLILTFLNSKLDIWLIEGYINVQQLGIYAIAAGVTQIVLALPQTIRQVLLPYLVKGSKTDNLSNMKLFAKLNGTVTILISLLLFFTADWLIVKAYGVAFRESVKPLLYLLPGIVFISYRSTFATYNMSQNTIRYNLFGNIIGFVIMLMLNIILLPKIGILGAAIASSVSYIASTIFIFLSVIIYHKLPWQNYFLLTPNDFNYAFQQIKAKTKWFK